VKLLGRVAPNVEEVRADAVKVGDRLAAGRFQEFSMSNVHRGGEDVTAVDHADGLIYIVGHQEPGYAWTLAPEDTVMIEKES
jgi:hypothetical protein